jgi:hypothetical protein
MRFLPSIQSLLLVSNRSLFTISQSCSKQATKSTLDRTRTVTTTIMSAVTDDSSKPWTTGDPKQAEEAKELKIWPLDEHNAALLNQVHPRAYIKSTEETHEVYDLIAIGSGAGGLVSSKQSSRRGAKRYVHILSSIRKSPCEFFSDSRFHLQRHGQRAFGRR